MISKELKFLLTHSSIYGLGTVVSQVVAFILLPLYTRYLTPTDYGILEMIDISSGIIGLVIFVGITLAFARFYYESEILKDRNTVVSTTYITYTAIAGSFLPLLYYICSPLASILFGDSNYGHFFRVSFTSLILGGIIDIGMLYLRLIKKPFIYVSVTLSRLALLIFFNILFIVYFHMGVWGILLSTLIVRSFYALLITTPILWKTQLAFSFYLSREMLKYALPMVPSKIASAAVKHSDKYFLLHFLSTADVGVYSLALKLGNAIHTLLTIPFNMAYVPRRFEIMNRGDAKETYSKVFSYYIFLLVYAGLALSTLIPEILQLMVTPDFVRAGDIIPLVAFSMIVFGCHNHFNFGILYLKKTKYIAYINLACSVIHFGLNFILISKFGLFGAVWSWIIIVGLQALLLYYVSQKLYPIEYELLRVLLYTLLAIVFYGLSTQIDTQILIIALSTKVFLLCVFPVAVILLRIVSPDETAKLKELYTTKIKARILAKLSVKAT